MEPYKPRAYAFIDASYIRIDYTYTLKKLFGERPGPMQVPVIRKWITRRFDIDKVYWYEAEPDEPQLGPGEENNEGALTRHARDKAICDAIQDEFDQVAKMPSWHVRRGTSSRRRKARDRGRQKEIDVLLASDAIEHAFRDNYEAALIIAGDLDFRPMVEVLERLGKTVGILHNPRSSAIGLREAADVNWPVQFPAYHALAGSAYTERHKFPSEEYKFPLPSKFANKLDRSKATILPPKDFGYSPNNYQIVAWFRDHKACIYVASKDFNIEYWCELKGLEVDTWEA
jgi:uncharacterized LabA/DUF88 family protein